MHARWTVSLAALAAVTLVLAGCASVPRGPAPSAEQAATLARQGNPAGAAQMYEALATESGGAARNGFALQAAASLSRGAAAGRCGRRPRSAVRRPYGGPDTGSLADRRCGIALQRGQAAHAWQLIGAIAVPSQAQSASRYLRLRQQVAFAAGHPAAGVEAEMQLEHWLLNAAAVQQSRVALLAQLRDAAERGVKVQPTAAQEPRRSEAGSSWRRWPRRLAHNPTVGDGRPDRLAGRDHPGHPAVEVVRSELLGEQPQPLAAQAHIALLLPITGSAGHTGCQRA